MDNYPPKSSKIKFLIIGALLVVALVLIFLMVRRPGKIEVEIKIAPKQALVTLNGKKTSANPFVSPGKYELEVAYEGFSSYKQTFEVSSKSPKKTFLVALAPQTGEAKRIADEQSKLYNEIEGLGGDRAQADNDSFLKNYPIVANVPYKTSYYAIDYGKDQSNSFVIQISSAAPVGRQVAIEKIRSWGFDPTDYNIQFVGLNNPFGTTQSGGSQ